MTTQILEDPRGLFSPETMTWKIHSDPAMAVGGIRALLQQALHPIAMDGVAKNSNFREDAWAAYNALVTMFQRLHLVREVSHKPLQHGCEKFILLLV